MRKVVYYASLQTSCNVPDLDTVSMKPATKNAWGTFKSIFGPARALGSPPSNVSVAAEPETIEDRASQNRSSVSTPDSTPDKSYSCARRVESTPMSKEQNSKELKVR